MYLIFCVFVKINNNEIAFFLIIDHRQNDFAQKKTMPEVMNKRVRGMHEITGDLLIYAYSVNTSRC